jgi:hypothetical protein
LHSYGALEMALAVIWVSVGVGVLLGLWQRVGARTTGPIRTFAVVAAGLVVALSLLPHAIASEGLAGLAVAMASVALIPALERLVRVPFRNVDAAGLRLELSFLGLLVHRLGDGVVMAVDGHGLELSWAVGAHEIPIVALVTLAYARRNLTKALVRAALLGLASSLGYWLVRAMPGFWHDLHGWVDAIAAGILLHILAYEALPDRLSTSRERALDVLGALLGVLIVLVPSFERHDGAPNVAQHLLRGTLAAAPWLTLGLAGSALWLARAPRRRQRMPCVAIARPWPGVEAFTWAMPSLGWIACSSLLLSASALAGLATALVRRVGTAERVAEGAPLTPQAECEPQPEPRSAWAALEALVLHVGGWIALGLLVQSYIESFVPGPEPLASLAPLARAPLALLVAIPASICTAGAVPIAAALVHKGLPPAIAVLGLALGPVLSNAIEIQLRAGMRLGSASLRLAPLALGTLGLGVALAFLVPGTRDPISQSVGVLEWAGLAPLAAIVAKSIWRVGIRSWLGSSLRSLGHAHAH